MTAQGAEHARVVMLGSGTPIPDPESSGPAVAIVAGGQAYLFDAGAGVVRRAEAAAEKYGIPELKAENLNRLFLTHLHSDHTLGVPDVILTPWVIGRSQPLEVFGPQGTGGMVRAIRLAYAEDIAMRTQGLEQLPLLGLTVNVHEIQPGVVYQDRNILVRAIPVCHGSWKQAFGYTIEAGGRTIVLSGDTGPCAALAQACRRCDVLVHEVYSAARFAGLSAGAKQYHSHFHTSTRELADLANESKPKLLVLYHQLYFGARDGPGLLKEIGQTYFGKAVNGTDLDIY